MVDAVPGQERHLMVVDGTDGDGGTGLAVRRVDDDTARIVCEERVQAATADDSEHALIVLQERRPVAARHGIVRFSHSWPVRRILLLVM